MSFSEVNAQIFGMIISIVALGTERQKAISAFWFFRLGNYSVESRTVYYVCVFLCLSVCEREREIDKAIFQSDHSLLESGESITISSLKEAMTIEIVHMREESANSSRLRL